jgi:hypothetical protein
MRWADYSLSGPAESVRTKQEKLLVVADNRICPDSYGMATTPAGPRLVVFVWSRVSVDE